MKPQTGIKKSKLDVPQYCRSPLVLFGSFLVLGFLAYANTFRADFHFDDYTSILNPRSVEAYLNLPLLWQIERQRFFLYLTFAFNYRIGQLEPFSYHVINWIIHIGSATGVFFLLKLIFRRQQDLFAAEESPKTVWMAWCGALFFLLHPIQTQAVTYVVQRTASLAALLYIFAVLFYGLARSENGRRLHWYALSAACTLLALFTKQNTFSLPAALLAYEFCFVPKTERSLEKLKRALPALGALFALPVIVYYFLYYRPYSSGLVSGFLEFTADINQVKLTRMEYFLTQQSVIPHYLRLVLMPIGQNLDYEWPIAKSFFETRTLLGSLALLGFLGAGIVCFIKGARAAAFGIFFFFIAVSIESSVIVIADVIYEHRMYLPMAGLCILFAVLLKNFAERFGHAMLLLLLICGALGVATYKRNEIWKTEGSLWADVLKKSPNNARAYMNVATEKANRDDLDGALPLYNKALELEPDSASALMNRGVLYQEQKKWELSKKDFLRLLEINPDNAKAAFYAGYSYMKLQKNDEAERYFKLAIQKNPDDHAGYYRLGHLYKEEDRLDDAAPLLLKTINLLNEQHNKTGRLDYADALKDSAMWLAGIHYGKKNFEPAIQFFDIVSGIAPKWGLAYYGKALAYGHLGNAEKVMEQIRELQKLREHTLIENLRKIIKIRKGIAPGEASKIEVDESLLDKPGAVKPL